MFFSKIRIITFLISGAYLNKALSSFVDKRDIDDDVATPEIVGGVKVDPNEYP